MMISTRKTASAFALATVFFASPIGVHADETSVAAVNFDAKTFVGTLVNDLSQLVSEAPEGSAARVDGLAAILSDRIATERMRGFILAKSAREGATSEQVAAYEDLFSAYIARSWAKSIDQLVSRTIELDKAVQRKPGEWVVTSKILNAQGKARADLFWQVLDVDGSPKLVNVTVRGQSFASDLKAQFSSLVKNEGFDALLDHMREVVAEA